MSSPTFSFQTRVTGATCQGLFVAEAHFLSPRHCFDNAVAGKKVDLVVEKSAVTATFTAIIKAPSTEVEDVALLTAGARHFRSTKAFNPNAFELPEKIFPPFPLTLNDGRVADPLVCSPLRYNVGGLVAYDCPTTGSMSGAVLMSSNSKPFAIHIGRKSGLGYALVLGSIKNELTGALGMSGRLETEGHK